MKEEMKETVKEAVKETVKKVVKGKLVIEGDNLESCAGKDNAKKLLPALNKFAADNKFDSVHFVRMFRAFRLYRGAAHVDWISLNELSHRYNLRLPPISGASRNYQKPVKRAYK